MFGYITVPNAPPPPVEPPLMPVPTPRKREKGGSKPRTKNQVAMPVLYDIACVALGIFAIAGIFLGAGASVPSIPWRQSDDEEAQS